MTTRSRIIFYLVMGAALIAFALADLSSAVIAELWPRLGIISVAAGLILLVARAFGRDILQEVADRYPWTARRWLGNTLVVLFAAALLGYVLLYATPAGPVLHYAALGFLLLALSAPTEPRGQRASAQRDGGAEAGPNSQHSARES